MEDYLIFPQAECSTYSNTFQEYRFLSFNKDQKNSVVFKTDIWLFCVLNLDEGTDYDSWPLNNTSPENQPTRFREYLVKLK